MKLNRINLLPSRSISASFSSRWKKLLPAEQDQLATAISKKRLDFVNGAIFNRGDEEIERLCLNTNQAMRQPSVYKDYHCSLYGNSGKSRRRLAKRKVVLEDGYGKVNFKKGQLIGTMNLYSCFAALFIQNGLGRMIHLTGLSDQVTQNRFEKLTAGIFPDAGQATLITYWTPPPEKTGISFVNDSYSKWFRGEVLNESISDYLQQQGFTPEKLKICSFRYPNSNGLRSPRTLIAEPDEKREHVLVRDFLGVIPKDFKIKI